MYKFERLFVKNRFKEKKSRKDGDRVIFGVQKWWSSPDEYCYKFCFFGLEIHVWFKRR